MLIRTAAVAVMLLLAQSPRDAGPVGVLVGIHDGGADPVFGDRTVSGGSLRTVWLSVEDPQHAEAVVPLEIPDLLLPRRTGFWRVGLVGTCSEDPHLDVDDK